MRLTRLLRFAAGMHSTNRTSCIDNAMTVLLVRATASPWLVFCRTTGILYLNWLASLGRTLTPPRHNARWNYEPFVMTPRNRRMLLLKSTAQRRKQTPPLRHFYSPD